MSSASHIKLFSVWSLRMRSSVVNHLSVSRADPQCAEGAIKVDVVDCAVRLPDRSQREKGFL